jgi:cytosine/adenosine deaminase-related metal-dependent hydrolase
VFCGNDGIRDTWGPFGTGDMLERASIVGWRADARHDHLLERVYAMCSGVGARVLGIAEHGVEEGREANFFTVRAETVAEAIGLHPPRGLVFFHGRLVARNGEPA